MMNKDGRLGGLGVAIRDALSGRFAGWRFLLAKEKGHIAEQNVCQVDLQKLVLLPGGDPDGHVLVGWANLTLTLPVSDSIPEKEEKNEGEKHSRDGGLAGSVADWTLLEEMLCFIHGQRWGCRVGAAEVQECRYVPAEKRVKGGAPSCSCWQIEWGQRVYLGQRESAGKDVAPVARYSHAPRIGQAYETDYTVLETRS